MDDLFKELYDKYEILSAALKEDKISERSAEYLECIEGTKGGPKEKKLTAQILAKFFKHFPALQDKALNALLDLCEENDSDIRIAAMKTLPQLCKDNKEHVTNIASVLSQLLQLEDQDYVVANNSLLQVFNEDKVNAVKGVLSNLQAADEGLREKIIKLVYKKLVYMNNSDAVGFEDLVILEGKKILLDCTPEEFFIIMPYLRWSKFGKTVAGQQELVDLVADKIEINESFDPLEEGTSNTDRLVLCVDSILPLFSVSVDSSKFVVYYCTQVLPRWQSIGTVEEGSQVQLRLLRQLAVMSTYCGNVENITDIVDQIFTRLKEYMPLPPENVDINKIPNLDFTSVECLLYAFHRLARKCPEFLTNDAERLKDFRLRLQYFARGVQGCKNGLKTTINTKLDELSKENLETVKLAPAVLDNINSLIKDLFYQTPLYKCNIKLSFKNETKKTLTIEKSPDKRHAPITFDDANGTGKKGRPNKTGEDRKLYQPPSGKFSSNFGLFDFREGVNG